MEGRATRTTVTSSTFTNCATHIRTRTGHRRVSRAPITPALPEWGSSSNRRRRQELHDLSVDHLDALVTRHADAVVAVIDEVLVPDLVKTNRRQLLAADERPVHPLPLAL